MTLVFIRFGEQLQVCKFLSYQDLLYRRNHNMVTISKLEHGSSAVVLWPSFMISHHLNIDTEIDTLWCDWDFIMIRIQINSKSIEDDVNQTQSHDMSDSPPSNIDFKNETHISEISLTVFLYRLEFHKQPTRLDY